MPIWHHCSGRHCMEGPQNQHIRSPGQSHFLPQQGKSRSDLIAHWLGYLVTTYYRLGTGWPEGRTEPEAAPPTQKVLILRWRGRGTNRKPSGVKMASAHTLVRSMEQGILTMLIEKRSDKTFQKGPLHQAFILSLIYTDKGIPLILNRYKEIWK